METHDLHLRAPSAQALADADFDHQPTRAVVGEARYAELRAGSVRYGEAVNETSCGSRATQPT